MSIITLQLGQCGNQLGYDLFNILSSEIPDGCNFSSRQFFREDARGNRTARCLLIDMEPKVVNSCVSRARSHTQWRFDESNIVVQQSGSGGFVSFTCAFRPPFLNLNVRPNQDQNQNHSGTFGACTYNFHALRADACAGLPGVEGMRPLGLL